MNSSNHNDSVAARPAILQLVPSLDAGGAERTAIDVAAALVGEGYAALVASEGGRMVPELLAAGGELIELPMASKSPVTMIANARALCQIIRTRNVKLVHARSRAPAWSGLWAARRTGVPFVTTYHGIYNASNALKRFYNSGMVRGRAVIANSQWTAAHIAREYKIAPEDITVIHRGVDLAKFDPANVSLERVAQLRAQWGVGENDLVILLPGRLTRWKGQLVLIEALSKLKPANTRTILAGDAQGRDAYESELRNAIAVAGLNVFIAGHVSDMAAAYLVADIVVSASTDPEAFGRVAAEAGAMSRPVIATDHGGARETILRGASGELVTPGDADALARALERMIAAGPQTRAAMGAAARVHIAENFTRERMCTDTLALYRRLIAEKEALR
ncbi:MAG TPA: glycosyltransferase family 4 protein [Rhizomicrobium sp.]|nr:glycosyltransferase family 4 protein [Rhizomicrobium sp.]